MTGSVLKDYVEECMLLENRRIVGD